MAPKLLEVSELRETNLSSRSSKSGSPSLRAPWKRHFFMELKTSGSFEGSDSTCSTSMQLRNLYHKIPKGWKKNFIHNSQIIQSLPVMWAFFEFDTFHTSE